MRDDRVLCRSCGRQRRVYWCGHLGKRGPSFSGGFCRGSDAFGLLICVGLVGEINFEYQILMS
jgi:hypothetical protein